LKEYDEALEDIKVAIKQMPKDKKLRDEYEAIKEEKKKHGVSQQELMKKFLSHGIYNEKKVNLKKSFNKLPDFNPQNPQTYFDIQIGEGEDAEKGRVVFEVFSK
jgi:hypothetical protein